MTPAEYKKQRDSFNELLVNEGATDATIIATAILLLADAIRLLDYNGFTVTRAGD